MNNRTGAVPSGPLAPYFPPFAAQLVTSGYSKSAAKKQRNLMVHLDAWLWTEGLELSALATDVVDEFFLARREAGRSNLLTRRSLVPLLSCTEAAGALPAPVPPQPVSAADVLVAKYAVYLRRERGLVEGTIRFYLRVVRRFVEVCSSGQPLELDKLAVTDVTGFLTCHCRELGVSSARQTVSALRSFLRYLRMEGVTSLALDQSVLSVAGWNPSLPRAIDPSQVTQLVGACDRHSAIGRRDHAILLLLARLGLRAGEVVAMELQDLDWRAGGIVVRGKRRRLDNLPLPADVGAAIAAYLRRGRPASDDRHVFLRHFAPHVGLAGPGAIGGVLERASARAGIEYVNPHRLRHTLATGMLRGGASLREVGLVLRQDSLTVTATYAKVDHGRLAAMALEWPEVGR
jgi:integrase/recombinase XerD